MTFDDQKFYDFVLENKYRKFKYGVWDCLTFVKGFINTKFGNEFIGKYKYKKEYLKIITKLGYTSIENYCDRHLEHCFNENLKRGDIALHNDALGICDGIYCVFLNKYGYTYVLTHKVDKGYKCPKL